VPAQEAENNQNKGDAEKTEKKVEDTPPPNAIDKEAEPNRRHADQRNQAEKPGQRHDELAESLPFTLPGQTGGTVRKSAHNNERAGE
jgi:hypothetical protein